MAEWFKAVDCKSIYYPITIGSNPILSNLLLLVRRIAQ